MLKNGLKVALATICLVFVVVGASQVIEAFHEQDQLSYLAASPVHADQLYQISHRLVIFAVIGALGLMAMWFMIVTCAVSFARSLLSGFGFLRRKRGQL